jgi:hypothetical protein
MCPVTVDYFVLEEDMKVILDHQPVAAKRYCYGCSGKSSLPDQKLHDPKAFHAHELEDFVCLYKRNVSFQWVEVSEESGCPALPLGVAGSIDSRYAN